jgi:predicted unusual protein kinase regulating ubiquinone biosynthesis (AarF/ABC1/UbiB family)
MGSGAAVQVYRGRLRVGGREVAVKVQRPGVRESIALDIYILRALAAFVKRWRRFNSDLPVLLDEVRFPDNTSHMFNLLAHGERRF